MALAPRDCHRDALSGSSTRTTDQPRPPTSSLLALVVHSSPSLFLSSSLIFCRQTLLFRRRIASPCCSPPSPRSSSRTSLSCRRTHARSHPRNATVLSPPPLSMCFSRFSRARRTGKEARGLQMRRWLFCTATSQSYRGEPTRTAHGRPKSSRWSDGSQGKGGGEACSGGGQRAEEEERDEVEVGAEAELAGSGVLLEQADVASHAVLEACRGRGGCGGELSGAGGDEARERGRGWRGERGGGARVAVPAAER